MLKEALEFPTSGDHGSSALLVGSALLAVTGAFVLFGVLLFPLLAVAFLARVVVRGYYVRVLRTATREREATAPPFDSFATLLEEGFVAVVVSVVYALPAVVLFLLAVGGNLLSAIRHPTAVAAAQTFGGLAALFGLLYLVGMAYVLPAAMANYAHAGSFEAAFRLRTILDGAFSEDYAVGWLLTVVVQLVVFPVVVLLQFLLVGFALQFVVGVAVRYVVGRSFAEAAELDAGPVPTEGITPDDGGRAGEATRPPSTRPSDTPTERDAAGPTGSVDATGSDSDMSDPGQDDERRRDERRRDERGGGDDDPMADDRRR